MFLFDALKKILSGQTSSLNYSSGTTTRTANTRTVDALPLPAAGTDFGTDKADSYVKNLHQERSLSINNGTVVGHSTGRIDELLGHTPIDAFEGLPNWLPSLSIQLTISATSGTLTAGLRQPDGSLAELTAPGSLETQAAVKGGKLSFNCEAFPNPAQGIHYDLTII